MLKNSSISKLAAIYRLQAFFSFASNSDVERALRQLKSHIDENDLIRIFELWQGAKDSVQDQQNLEQYTDSILQQYADSPNFDTIYSSINTIHQDVEDNADAVFKEEIDNKQRDIDSRSLGRGELIERIESERSEGRHVTQDSSVHRGNDAENKRRYRSLLPSLRTRPDYKNLQIGVQNNVPNDELGITSEQYYAIRYELNTNKTRQQRVENRKNILRLMRMGLTEEQAKEKYKSIQEFNTMNEEKIKSLIEKAQSMGHQISEEEVRKRLSEIGSKEIDEYKKKKIIKMTTVQSNKILRYLDRYVKYMIKNNVPEEEAVNKANSMYAEMKNKIKYLPMPEKEERINDFLQSLKTAV